MSLTFVGEPATVDDATRDVLELVRASLMAVFGSQKAAALSMGVDHSLLSRQLAGTERLPLAQLTRFPAVMSEFSARLARHCGHRVRRRNARSQQRRELARQLRRVVDLLSQFDAESES